MAKRKPPGVTSNPFAVVVWTPPLERPRSTYAIFAAVCDRIEAGELIEDAAWVEGTTRKSIHQWAREYPALGDMYARAREASAEQLESQALRIASSYNPMPGRFDARLAVDTLKWAAAKRRPKVYSERMEHVMVEDPRTLPREEVQQKVKDMRRRLKLA